MAYSMKLPAWPALQLRRSNAVSPFLVGVWVCVAQVVVERMILLLSVINHFARTWPRSVAHLKSGVCGARAWLGQECAWLRLLAYPSSCSQQSRLRRLSPARTLVVVTKACCDVTRPLSWAKKKHTRSREGNLKLPAVPYRADVHRGQHVVAGVCLRVAPHLCALALHRVACGTVRARARRMVLGAVWIVSKRCAKETTTAASRSFDSHPFTPVQCSHQHDLACATVQSLNQSTQWFTHSLAVLLIMHTRRHSDRRRSSRKGHCASTCTRRQRYALS